MPRAAGLTAASSCLYLAGMALNDYADREVDAVERPGRPIPSGRVTPGFALGLAAGLTAAAAGLAVAADGPRALAVLAPLAATVWAYDLALKTGPGRRREHVGLPRARRADGQRRARRARRAPRRRGRRRAHRRHHHRLAQRGRGRDRRRCRAPRWPATAAVAAAAGGLAARRSRSPLRRLAAAGLVGAYAKAVGGAHADAARDPSPARLQRAVGVSVLGLMPLEAGLLAGAGALVPAGGVAALWPLARTLAARRSVT